MPNDNERSSNSIEPSTLIIAPVGRFPKKCTQLIVPKTDVWKAVGSSKYVHNASNFVITDSKVRVLLYLAYIIYFLF